VRLVIVAGLGLALAGCAVVDAQARANGSEFIPSPDRTSFVYRANGNSDPSGDGHASPLYLPCSLHDCRNGHLCNSDIGRHRELE
jgi:hypothetical protein